MAQLATQAGIDRWFQGAIGRYMNPDNAYGFQCKDTADDYCIAIFGDWKNTIKPGNGKDVFSNANPNYFNKVRNDFSNPNQIPPKGAIINWGASRAVPEGHVAIVESATAHSVTVIQQDGYLQYPARRVTLGYVLPNGATVIGWLVPKLQPKTKPATINQVKEAYLKILERPADASGIAHYTKYPIDFVRADLLRSAERARLEGRKAAAARAAADAAKRAEALRAEQQRIAEEKAAAERAKLEAERQAEEVRQAEALAEKEREEADRIAAEQAARDEADIPPAPEPPVHIPTDDLAQPEPSPAQPEAPNPFVRFLFSFIQWVNRKK